MSKIPVKALYDNCEMMRAEKWGYIWGTAGVLWTEARQNAVENEMAIKYGSRWIGHHVADCSGVMVYIWRLYGLKIPHGSNSIKRQSVGALTNLPQPGYAAFKVRDGDYYHIGIVGADGKTVYESQGTIAGFVTSDASRWDCFAPFKDVQYEEVQLMPDGERVTYRAEVTTQSGPLNVRSGDGTQYPIIDRLPKGEIVDVMVVCPNGWCYIDDDGEQGYVDGRYLTPLPSEPTDDKTPAEDDKTPESDEYTTLKRSDGVMITLRGQWDIYWAFE